MLYDCYATLFSVSTYFHFSFPQYRGINIASFYDLNIGFGTVPTLQEYIHIVYEIYIVQSYKLLMKLLTT